MKLNPTILTDNKQSYVEQVSRCAKFADEIDIDVIDWEYTPGKTLSAEESLDINVQLPLNFDLMMDYPSSEIDVLLKDERVRKIIINIRSKQEILPLLEKIKAAGKKTAMSFSMAEEYEQVKQYFDVVDAIHIFAIEPGAQGKEFRPEMLSYSIKLKEHGFKGQIGLDGGVNKRTIPMIANYPFDVIVSGSAIAKSADPEQIYWEMVDMLAGLC